MDKIVLTVYTYAHPYRFKSEYVLDNADEIDHKLFLHKLGAELVGYRAVNTLGVVKEWWDNRAKQNYATARDKDGE